MSDIERDLDFELTDEFAIFLTDLHASEINGEISWFFDNVWGAKISDKLNGYKAESTELPSIGHAARWLCDRALEFYPDSVFAKNYLQAHPGYKPLTPAASPHPRLGRRSAQASYRGTRRLRSSRGIVKPDSRAAEDDRRMKSAGLFFAGRARLLESIKGLAYFAPKQRSPAQRSVDEQLRLTCPQAYPQKDSQPALRFVNLVILRR